MVLSPIKERLFTVAILGRQNVGKSTLYNCLLRSRKAITDPTPGVTRDAIDSECSIEDLRFRLVDTGGFNLEDGEIERLVSNKSESTGENADLILLVMDVNSITGADERFIERLRWLNEKLILVINKVDNKEQDAAAANFYKLGFSRLISVSSAHNRNINELRRLIYEAAEGFDSRTETSETELIKLSILGKPNTGKSTLLNRILNEEKSIVSEIPGTTRDTVTGLFTYNNIRFRIMDTAGIRRKKKIYDDVEYYSVNRAIKSINDADIVFLLIDCNEGLTEQDKKIAFQAVKKGRGIVLVLNKWDIMPNTPNQFRAVKDRVRFLFPLLDFAPILHLSALTGEGINDLLESALLLHKQLNRKIDTHELNQALKIWIERYRLPVRGKNVKIRYAVQVSINPVKFIFFVNHLKRFPHAYLKYLKNRIRQDFGFKEIPLILEARES